MSPKEEKQDFVTQLKDIIENQGGQRPASTILKNIDTAALVSKFVKSRPRQVPKITDETGDTGFLGTGVDQISRNIMSRIDDNENIFKLFPDIELAAQIVISSILSPKDMVSSELIYKLSENLFPPVVATKMIEVIRSALETEYELKKDAPLILRRALFESGSYVKAILPEAAVDYVINQGQTITTESIVNTKLFTDTAFTKPSPKGLLGDPRTKKSATKLFAIESAGNYIADKDYDPALYIPTEAISQDFTAKFGQLVSETIQVTDNDQLLKLPKLIEQINAQTVSDLAGSKLSRNVRRFVTENYHVFKPKSTNAKITVGQLEQMVYKSPNTQYKSFTSIPTKPNLKRKSVGRPLVLNIPSEAAIPVHVPGDVTNHIGYFVPVDSDGNPLSINSVSSYGEQGLSALFQGDRSNSAISGMLTEKARKNLGADGNVPVIERMATIYADLIEKDLLERLLRGAHGRKLKIGRNDEIYRIMLARTLQSQMTRLIYVPGEYISYFAFNYHRNGTGKSYLDDLANITSLRAMVMFSNVMAKVKSSITTTNVNVALDPRDPDPIKTVEMAKHMVTRARQQYFPHGLNRVVDLTDWIQSAGVKISFSGHPRLPETKFEFESSNITHTPPDDTLDEMFRHQTYMHFGLSPETVDSAVTTDFATTIEHNSVLFSRRITLLSDAFSLMLSSHGRKIIENDEVILEALTKILNEHSGDLEKMLSEEEKSFFTNDAVGFTSYVIQSFLDLLVIDLPKPETTKNESLKTAFQTYEEMLESALNYVFSTDIMAQEFVGQTAEHVDAARKVWKASLMRSWMANNNYTPEAFDIAAMGEDGKPMVNLLDSSAGHTEAIMLSIVGFIDKMKATKAAADKDLGQDNNGSMDTNTDQSSDDIDPSGTTPFDTSVDEGGEGASDVGEDETDPAAEGGFDNIPGLD